MSKPKTKANWKTTCCTSVLHVHTVLRGIMKWGREGRRKLGADNFHYCTSLFFMYLYKAKGCALSVSVCECVVVQLQPQNEATVIANHVKAALPVPDKRTN